MSNPKYNMENLHKNNLKYKHLNFDFKKYVNTFTCITINKLYDTYGTNIDKGMCIKKIVIIQHKDCFHTLKNSLSISTLRTGKITHLYTLL